MGTGFLEVNIQPYRGWEGWAAPRRLHVWCVCLRVRLFPVPSSSTSLYSRRGGGGCAGGTLHTGFRGVWVTTVRIPLQKLHDKGGEKQGGKIVCHTRAH